MLRREVHGDVEVLRLEHGKANAMDLEFCTALGSTLRAIRADGPASLVLAARGSIYSAGVDLPRVVEGGPDYVARFLPALSDAILELFTLPLPTVAAVNGHAIAGGCLLAIGCDHVVAATGNGRIGVPELLVGVPFPAVGIEILRQRAGDAVTRSLVLSGRTESLADARALGLVDELGPAESLLTTALAAARRLAAVPSATYALTKRQLAAPALERLARDAARDDAEVREIWRRPEVQDSLRTFAQRTLRK